MHRVARWFINHVKSPANRGLYRWLTRNLPLSPEADCLEVGCGNGNMALRILQGLTPRRFVATDVDPRQVEAADAYVRRRSGGRVPDRLELRTADMNRLPFPDASFDGVFAFCALHHASARHADFTNVPGALAELDRVLRPKGLLAYEEFLHREPIRDWLASHEYGVVASRYGWRRDLVVVRKG